MARILVIDDNDLIRTTVEGMLKMGGHEVALAFDGDDGIQKFQEQAFDLVICDVFMPNKEGLETVREIRQLSASTPIISMTGSIAQDLGGSGGLDPDFLRMAGEFGATRTITKPFKTAQLLALVQECLGASA